MGQPLTVDDVVAMMSVMDADGDGEVTKEEFCSYYQRLKRCGEAELEAQWKRMDVNADGILTVSELCSYHGIDAGQCSEGGYECRFWLCCRQHRRYPHLG